MAAAPELPARFTPLQRASVARRALVLVAGPLLWLVGLVVVGTVVDRLGVVEFALALTGIAFLVSVPLSALARRRRLRAEREADRR